eukprot:scaffold619_cov368-Pavlova_lutheri.AAC.9
MGRLKVTSPCRPHRTVARQASTTGDSGGSDPPFCPSLLGFPLTELGLRRARRGSIKTAGIGEIPHTLGPGYQGLPITRLPTSWVALVQFGRGCPSFTLLHIQRFIASPKLASLSYCLTTIVVKQRVPS